jgi:transcriptional regulator GlxA family with amidase domain
LFASHLRALARERQHIPDANLPALVDATLELLASALAPADAPRISPYQQSALTRIQSFILAKLDDPALNPDVIAAAHRISARQLHRIFEASDSTVERWIWSQRLTRCRHELVQPGSGSISAVAFKWGFNDAAHFSRAFREQFGVSPREFRKQSALGTTAAV